VVKTTGSLADRRTGKHFPFVPDITLSFKCANLSKEFSSVNFPFVKPIIDNHYKLQRFPGKGGWTFAQIPEILQDKSKPFGWVKVRGMIDGFEIQKCHLMPMGNGKLFLPVRSEIRKKIKKESGDTIHVILYPDDKPLKIPKEMLACLKDEPNAHRFFKSLSESEQLFYIRWIYSAKKEETKIARLAKSVNRLSQGLKLHDKIE
jgi:hypothetical protein